MKETDIRPEALFDRYLELSRRDIHTFFADQSRFLDIGCPACLSRSHRDSFVKLGFAYQLCDECGSLYLSPRPTEEMQFAYARESEAVKFWSTHFYKETAEARREKIFRPRAELLEEMVRRGVISRTDLLADIGSGYGMLLEEVCRIGTFGRVLGIEPVPDLASVCRQKGFAVVEKFVEQIEEGEIGADVATAFEVVEHVFDPSRFLQACRRALQPGGVLLFTTLTITGFDLQILWSESHSIYPPHHINLMSFDGMRRLVERSGLEVVEITTPGKLDVDIVANALASNSGIEVPRFIRELLRRPPSVQEDFQSFLQRANLSSHIRILARRSI